MTSCLWSVTDDDCNTASSDWTLFPQNLEKMSVVPWMQESLVMGTDHMV